jgi:PAS domain S-box-containing protein
VVAAVQDVTERTQLEQALWHSQQQLRLLVGSVADYAILMLDPAGRVVSWNEGAERIKGRRREEIIGEHLSRFYPPEQVAAGAPARMLEAAVRDARVEDEGWRLRKDGSRFRANVVVTAVYEDAGVLHGFAKVTRDLSQRRLLEEQQRRLALLAERERIADGLFEQVVHALFAVGLSSRRLPSPTTPPFAPTSTPPCTTWMRQSRPSAVRWPARCSPSPASCSGSRPQTAPRSTGLGRRWRRLPSPWRSALADCGRLAFASSASSGFAALAVWPPSKAHQGWVAAQPPGVAFPTCRCLGARFLAACMRPGTPAFHLLLCGAPPAWDRQLLTRFTQRYGSLVAVHRLGTEPFGADLCDPSGAALARLGARNGAQYLIRPDGYVGYRCAGFDLEGLERHLAHLLQDKGKRSQ